MKSSVAAVVINPRSGGFWRSSRHPAEGEIITGGIYIAMPASEVMREQFIFELRVHSSS